ILLSRLRADLAVPSCRPSRHEDSSLPARSRGSCLLMSETLALGALVGLVVVVLIRLRRRGARSARAIAPLTPGWAEVRGCVHVPATMCGPISGRVGLGWRVLVEEETGLRGWQPVVDLCECVDFEVADDSGSIRVRAGNSPITIEVAEQRGHGGP